MVVVGVLENVYHLDNVGVLAHLKHLDFAALLQNLDVLHVLFAHLLDRNLLLRDFVCAKFDQAELALSKCAIQVIVLEHI